jgi:AbrB family looped-hinge helix DNA binding protein
MDFSGKNSYSHGMKAILSQKGQVTLPKKCRDRLGLKSGAVLDFRAENGKLIASKVEPQDKFRKWRGKGRLPGGQRVDEYLKRVRG